MTIYFIKFRYDESCTGEVDYAEFVEKVMESDFKGVAESSIGKKLNGMVSSAFSGNSNEKGYFHNDDDDDSDCDEEEREMFTRSEVKKMFDMVDTDKEVVTLT